MRTWVKNWHLIDTHKGAVISEQCYILSQNYVMQIDYFQHSILFGQPDASIFTVSKNAKHILKTKVSFPHVYFSHNIVTLKIVVRYLALHHNSCKLKALTVHVSDTKATL